MENEGRNQRTTAGAGAGAGTTTISNKVRETDFLLQWGNRKRLRCLKVKGGEEDNGGTGVIRKKITSRVDRRVVRTTDKDSSLPSNQHNNKNCDGLVMNNNNNNNRSRSNENLKSLPSSSSPEKEERYYTTRGSVGVDENGKNLMEVGGVEEKGIVWPKLFISLSSKEKEEDFMAMKGCKPPQRPKKRAKFIQKTLLLVSPGAWLSDLCQERYEVREKKTSKKRPRGLKAMGSMESDSE